jgi:aromatic ring-opening dioxygenase catalytic subunit (LigB family)
MAKIVAAMAMTHSPGLAGWFDSAPAEEQQMARDAFSEMRAHLKERSVDVIILVGNDHLLNWPMNNTPNYTVGIDDEHVGPADWYDDWLNQKEKFAVPGHSDLARYIVNESARCGVAMSSKRKMQFDDSVTVPTLHLNPQGEYPMVPINLNCTVPPVPDQVQSYEFGITLGKILQSYPGDERIALVATGGLSHEPGGPRYFHLDEAFDRDYLALLEKGNHKDVLREITMERMEEAGSGGTGELIAWFIVMAATRGAAKVLGYTASYSWRSGTGFVIWPELARSSGSS